MAVDDQPPEIKIVILYRAKLRQSLRNHDILERKELIAMRDHIKKYSTNLEGSEAIAHFRVAHELLLEYVALWNKHHKNIEEPVIVPELVIPLITSTALMKIEKPSPTPKKTWEEEDITANDLRFLKSLRIASGDKPIYPEKNNGSDNKS